MRQLFRTLLYLQIVLAIFDIASVAFAKDKYGYEIVVEAVQSKKGFLPYAKALSLTAFPLPPNPDGSLPYVFKGIDLSDLGADKNNPAVLKELAYYYIHKIQGAYDVIASEKGLFVLGDEFHQNLHTREPFGDGRSAFTAIFDGWDFLRPQATLGLSYSTPSATDLPIALRVNQPMNGFVKYEPIKPILDHEHEMPLDIGLDFSKFIAKSLTAAAKVMHPEIDGHWFENKLKDLNSELESLVAQGASRIKSQSDIPAFQEWINIQASEISKRIFQNGSDSIDAWAALAAAEALRKNPELAKKADFKSDLSNSLQDNLKSFVQSQLKTRGLFTGGYPAQLRSLTHTKGPLGEDYMLALFLSATAKGLFDQVPANLNLPIPDWFIGETSPKHLETAYKNWHFEVLKTFYDSTFKGDVSVVKLTRQGLSELFKFFFVRLFVTDANKNLSPQEILDSEIIKFSSQSLSDSFQTRASILNLESVPNFKIKTSLQELSAFSLTKPLNCRDLYN